jgi:hypothetical protein
MATEEQGPAPETIAYVRHMLGELRILAQCEGCEMLSYLIEMAYVEAGDVQLGRRRSKLGRGESDSASGFAS